MFLFHYKKNTQELFISESNCTGMPFSFPTKIQLIRVIYLWIEIDVVLGRYMFLILSKETAHILREL